MPNIDMQIKKEFPYNIMDRTPANKWADLNRTVEKKTFYAISFISSKAFKMEVAFNST
jgi:hypothetical protein